jgi:hypothetical protein
MKRKEYSFKKFVDKKGPPGLLDFLTLGKKHFIDLLI